MDLRLSGSDDIKLDKLRSKIESPIVSMMAMDDSISVWADKKTPSTAFDVWMYDAESDLNYEMDRARQRVNDHSLKIATVHNLDTKSIGTMHLVVDSSGSIASFQEEHEMESYLMDQIDSFRGEL